MTPELDPYEACVSSESSQPSIAQCQNQVNYSLLHLDFLLCDNEGIRKQRATDKRMTPLQAIRPTNFLLALSQRQKKSIIAPRRPFSGAKSSL